ncbi:MAG: hypothetical protein ABI925_05510 [Verrucomicrobiota bacterium]
MRKLIRSLVLRIAQTIGTQIRDFESGRSLGRALIIPWRGKLHVIGLKVAVRPMFQPQKRLTYWKQEIVFAEYPSPDFPRIPQVGPETAGRGGSPEPPATRKLNSGTGD